MLICIILKLALLTQLEFFDAIFSILVFSSLSIKSIRVSKMFLKIHKTFKTLKYYQYNNMVLNFLKIFSIEL